MKQGSFVFYESFCDSVSDMEDEERLSFYEAIFGYVLYGKEPKINRELTRLFKLVKPLLDTNSKRKTDGKKGGRPKKKEDETIGFDEKNNEETRGYIEDKNQEKTSGFESENHRLKNKKPNVNVNVNVNEDVNENNCNIFEFIEKEFGRTLSPTEIEKIQSFQNDDLVRYAVEEAVLSNARTMRFVEAVIFELEKNGIQTYNAAKSRVRQKACEQKESKLPVLTLGGEA